VAGLGLARWRIHDEIPTRDGSRLDLVHVHDTKLTAFELKMAEPGQALAPLDARALRQLRHYCKAADLVYVVTVAAARRLTIAHDGQTLHLEPLEHMALPVGVGWVVFDRLTRDLTVLAPAEQQEPDTEDRAFVLDQLANRLGKAQRAIRRCR